MSNFEYKVVELHGKRENHEYILNVEGAQGWELVTVLVPGGVLVAGLGRIVGYLKRPKGSSLRQLPQEEDAGSKQFTG